MLRARHVDASRRGNVKANATAAEVPGAVSLINRAVVPEIAQLQLSGRLCPLLTAFVGIRISPRVLGVRISPRASGSGGLCRVDLTALQQEKLVFLHGNFNRKN